MAVDTANPAIERAYEEGLDLLRLGKVEAGVEALLAIAPEKPKAWADVAYAYHVRQFAGKDRRKDDQTALGYLEQYIRHYADDAGGWGFMAELARRLRELPRAAEWAEKSARLDSGNAERWYELGMIHHFLGNSREAVRAFDRGLRADPSYSKCRPLRAFHARRIWRDRVRRLTWKPPVKWALRWLISRRLVSGVVERMTGIALDDPRWRITLPAGIEEACPADQDAERFAAHFERCECGFWKWFRARKIEGKIRKVLEVGSGAGNVAHHFAREYEVESVAITELARRDRERRGIEAVRGDMHMIPGRGGRYDLVVAPWTLHRSRALFFALWEWKRQLRPDGYLFLMVHLPVDRPAPKSAPLDSAGEVAHHYSHGIPGHVTTLTYWQLRWLFQLSEWQLIAETLEDPASGRLEGVEWVDGRRAPDPLKAWNAFFLLRKPGRLPHDGALEKPRPLTG